MKIKIIKLICYLQQPWSKIRLREAIYLCSVYDAKLPQSFYFQESVKELIQILILYLT